MQSHLLCLLHYVARMPNRGKCAVHLFAGSALPTEDIHQIDPLNSIDKNLRLYIEWAVPYNTLQLFARIPAPFAALSAEILHTFLQHPIRAAYPRVQLLLS